MPKFLVNLNLFLVVLIGILQGSTTSAYAITTPDFPFCSNPTGVKIVDYSNGTHGIVGETSDYNGSDAVYQITSDTLTQCFCSIDGAGIQTNWWRISSLAQDEIDSLIKDGWNLVPNGALWGLQEAPYLAKNVEYSCTTSSQEGNTSTTSTSSSGDSTSDPGVLGASTIGSVLGLASTGNNALYYSLPIIGLISLILGLSLRKKNS